MTVQRYDFSRPGRAGGGHLPSDLERELTAWLRDTCVLAVKKWSRQFPFATEMSCGSLETLRAAEALGNLPEAAVVHCFAVHEETNFTALALPCPLATALAAGLLGEVPDKLQQDRELTPVEESLCDYLVQDFLLAALRETWTGSKPLFVGTAQKVTNPKWARLFRPEEVVVRCTLSVRGPFGDLECWWLASLRGLLRQFGQAEPEAEQPQPPDQAPHPENVVRELQVEVSVILGNAQVPLAQLALLRPGDVVILDQRVTEPMNAHISGVPMFKGWPGRAGSRQVFRIESFLDG